MKIARFCPAAEAEMIAAAAYYAVQQADLGRQFLASVQNAINRICVNPRIFPIVESDVRRRPTWHTTSPHPK